MTSLGDPLRSLIVDLHVCKGQPSLIRSSPPESLTRIHSPLGLGTWVQPPHEDAFGPEDFLHDVQDGMSAALILLQGDDVPMPWEFDICQYHKHDVTAECERKHARIASEWDFDEGPSLGLQVQQPPQHYVVRRSPRRTGRAQAPSYTYRSPEQKTKNASKGSSLAPGKLKRVKRSKTR